MDDDNLRWRYIRITEVSNAHCLTVSGNFQSGAEN